MLRLIGCLRKPEWNFGSYGLGLVYAPKLEEQLVLSCGCPCDIPTNV